MESATATGLGKGIGRGTASPVGLTTPGSPFKGSRPTCRVVVTEAWCLGRHPGFLLSIYFLLLPKL